MTEILRVKLYQPTAHFRVPFSYKRRFTYPLVPLSTVKGLLCNLIGIKSDEDEVYKHVFSSLSLAVYGKFSSILKEYTWFRNLNRKEHKKKFGSETNRVIDFLPQHPGGQIPVTLDTLTDNRTVVYIASEDLKIIKDAFCNPVNRNDAVSLGRSEDMLVIEDVSVILPERKDVLRVPFYTWIPDMQSADEKLLCEREGYDDFFKYAPGNIMKSPLFYKITNDNARVFEKYATVKLYEGGFFRKKSLFFYDTEMEIPLIFTKVRL